MASARFWKRAVDVFTVTAFVAGLVTGRRCVQHVRDGRFVLPSALLLAIFAAGTQADIFIERTPWWRDGGLQESHINEVPAYSVALYAVFALIPVIFLAIDLVTSRREKVTLSAEVPSGAIDGRAVAAIAMPLLHLVANVMWIVPFLALVWLAEPFSRRLKVVATAAVVAPVAGFISWAVFIGDIDDGVVAIYATLGAFLMVWARLAVVALRPLRSMEVRVVADPRKSDA